MAYDYEKTKKAYESLSKEQKQEFVDKSKDSDIFKQFQSDYLAEINGRNNSPKSDSFVDPSVLHDMQVNGLSQSQLDAKWGTGTYNNAQTSLQSTNSGLNGSIGGLSTKSTSSSGAIPNSYVNQGPGNYSYNPVSGYYEKVVNKGNNQNLTYNEDSQHYGILNTTDKTNPSTTYSWDTTGKTNDSLLNNTLNQTNQTNIDLTGNVNQNMNKWGDFSAAVNSKLQTAFGIQDLNALKEKYPEQYPSLIQALDSVAGTWNSLDPSQRGMLEGQLQAIIGTAVGAGSDTSQLNVLSESILAKFKNPDQVKKFVSDVTRLKTEGMTTAEIANQMGVSEDMVQQGILAANGLDNKLGEHFELTEEASKDITEDYDTQIERLEKQKEIQLERANRQIEWLKQDYETQKARQEKANEIAAHNADVLAGMYGYGFSKRGIEGLNYVQEQAQQILDDMLTNYDRNNLQMAEGVEDILRNWEWNNEDLLKASEDALTQAKNNYTSNMLAIQQQYGTVGMQAQQQLANNVQNFITQAESIYDNALNRQQQNLTNLITNFSNLNALQYSNLTLRNAQIQQFQNESMNLNRNQLQGLAQQLGMDSASLQDLVNYQAQAVANQLNGYIPGSGVQLQSQIKSYLDQGYTPNQALSMIMNSQDFKNLQATGGENKWSISGGIMYNQATGEYYNLNEEERGSAGGGTIFNKNTGEVKTVGGGTVSTTNPDTGAYQKVKLGETPNEDTGIKNVYGSTVKLAPTVGAMFTEAYNKLAAQGIELKVGDSYRSYETQKKAYESGKAGVVSPDKSFHVLGQAFDVVQDGSMYTDEVVQALLDAGFTRPNAKEPRHWSYGEGKDAFGGKPRNTTAYDMADAILNGVGTLPAKNSKEYSDMVIALNDRVKQIWGTDYPEGIALINYSVINDKDLSDTLSTSISSTMQSIYSTDMLIKTLEDNNFKTGPIISRLAKLNPRDADYAAIQADINQMASNIARGFGEKGVLTDEDIKRYMKTIPNEKMGNKAQEVVGTLLKAKLYDGLVRTLESQAKSRRDVSMYAAEYQEAINWLQQNGFRSGGGRGLQGTIDITSRGR